MSQEVVQWLREIQDLRQQLAEAQQAQEAANASADNWRRLYETEAQQRRTEAASARQTIAALRAELETLQALPQPSSRDAIAQAGIEQAIAQFQTPAQLKAKLLEVWTAHDRLVQTLKVEQANHIQTRKNLTTALGDTMEMLRSKLRQEQDEEGDDDQTRESYE